MIRTCQQCGKIFKAPPSDTGKFCSLNCYWQSMLKREKLTCPSCGIEFEAKPSSHRIYCSLGCQPKERDISEETRQRMSRESKGKVFRTRPYSHSENTKRLIGEANKLSHPKGVPLPEEIKRKISETMKRKFASGEIKPNIPPKPNKKEQQLQSILDKFFPNEWLYVGNGEIRIENYYPDFININSKKLIIELFGEHWHTNPDRDQKRINTFSRYGYKTLIIWDKELKELPRVAQKVEASLEL